MLQMNSKLVGAPLNLSGRCWFVEADFASKQISETVHHNRPLVLTCRVRPEVLILKEDVVLRRSQARW